jgi:hypothetical protein
MSVSVAVVLKLAFENLTREKIIIFKYIVRSKSMSVQYLV